MNYKPEFTVDEICSLGLVVPIFVAFVIVLETIHTFLLTEICDLLFLSNEAFIEFKKKIEPVNTGASRNLFYSQIIFTIGWKHRRRDINPPPDMAPLPTNIVHDASLSLSIENTFTWCIQEGFLVRNTFTWMEYLTFQKPLGS